jgi:hypothetical protein
VLRYRTQKETFQKCFFITHPKIFYSDELGQVVDSRIRCIEERGDYVEKQDLSKYSYVVVILAEPLIYLQFFCIPSHIPKFITT